LNEFSVFNESSWVNCVSLNGGAIVVDNRGMSKKSYGQIALLGLPWEDEKWDRLALLGEQLVADGFSVVAYASAAVERRERYNREKKLSGVPELAGTGWEFVHDEVCGSYFGYCDTCGEEPWMVDLMATSYLVCFRCKKCKWWEMGYVGDDPDEKQAKNLLAIISFDEANFEREEFICEADLDVRLAYLDDHSYEESLDQGGIAATDSIAGFLNGAGLQQERDWVGCGNLSIPIFPTKERPRWAELVIKSNCVSVNSPCPICGCRTDPGVPFAVFAEGSPGYAPVCGECIEIYSKDHIGHVGEAVCYLNNEYCERIEREAEAKKRPKRSGLINWSQIESSVL
jgi:hypothetical protein